MSTPVTDRPARGLLPTLKDWYAALKRRTQDWLERPMTSFHLLLAVFCLLLGYGLLMVLSSSAVTAYQRTASEDGSDGSSFSVFKSQALFAAIGLVAFWMAMRVKLSWLRAMSTTGMIVALGLLVVVLGFPPINGAHSWISLGPIGFQPSEVAKFALVIWGANVLASRRANLGSWKELLIPVLPVAGLMGVLIMLEPDLGTTAALLVIVFALFFFAGASWKLFASLAVLGVGGVVVLAMSADYRMARLVSFLNPEADPNNSGLQLLQGLYGMADGGWFGVGLGQSRAKWAYLPHAESDFIFAIVGEELGFLGAGLLIALYVTLALVGLRIARRNLDPFIKLVSATSTAWLVGQAAINIFYVIGLLPVTGLTLPMISAGGTSLLVTMTIFGLLANFSRREPQAMAVLQNSGPGPVSRFFGIGVPGAGADESKASRRRDERKQNREWARASRRKAVDERKTLRAAAKQRPLDRRDESVRAGERRVRADQRGPVDGSGRGVVPPQGRVADGSGRGVVPPQERVPQAGSSMPDIRQGRPLRDGQPVFSGRRPESSADGPDPRSAVVRRPGREQSQRVMPTREQATSGQMDRTPAKAGSGGVLGWLGFGQPKPGQQKVGQRKPGQQKAGQQKAGQQKAGQQKVGQQKVGQRKVGQPKPGQPQPGAGRPRSARQADGHAPRADRRAPQSGRDDR